MLSYIVDVTADFPLAGTDILILFWRKRHKDPAKRSDVRVLLTKLQSTGAQNGVVVAATGFQSGALEAQALGGRIPRANHVIGGVALPQEATADRAITVRMSR